MQICSCDGQMKIEGRVVLVLLLCVGIAYAVCPINLDYVTKISWNSSYCRSIQTPGELDICRTTLRTVFGIGLAEYLRTQSRFELPDNASAVACFEVYQQKLSNLGLAPNVVQKCFNNTSEFVSSHSLCAGIQTKQNWIEKVGYSALDTVCKGDLSGVSECRACYNGGETVHRQLLGMVGNISEAVSRKCYYFICLYAAGVVNKSGPKSRQVASCILRVPFLRENTSRRRVFFYGFLSAATGFFLLCGLLLGYFFWPRIKGRAKHKHFVSKNRSLLQGFLKPNTGAVWFSIRAVREATGNFSDANVIGQGGFGTVYKGRLPDGREIAVKRLRNCTAEGDSEFINEVEIINKIRHRNLVVLRGFCVASDDGDGRQRFLIYDYMSNGSLDEHIFERGENNRIPPSWEQRKNIAIGTAKGLMYLHYGVHPAIFHRDIKATNILLDDQMNACVADFGLARMTSEGQSHLTTRIAGTHGYLAPEYALYGQLTDRSDVYSFGVLLLEIMSGRKALDTSTESVSDYLITDWAWKLVKSGKTMQVIDTRIRESGSQKQMERFVLVGILCAHVMVAFRPSMVEALKLLEGEVEIPAIPDRPLPLIDQGFLTDESGYSSFASNFHHSFSSTASLIR